jgi:hypothetical protein
MNRAGARATAYVNDGAGRLRQVTRRGLQEGDEQIRVGAEEDGVGRRRKR